MNDCIFCKIIAGSIPSKKLYEDETCLAFFDIAPEAPTHFLIIPKAHISSAAYITAENADVIAHIFTIAARLAKELQLDKGYRMVTNVGENGGQTVAHLHFHILAGRSLAWPPG